MNKASAAMVLAFVAGCLVTSAVFSGCSEAAYRTLTIHQLQSTDTYDGEFLVDTSELPDNAIEYESDNQNAGKPEKPSTRIHLNAKYEVEVVLRLVGKAGSR